MLHPFGLLGSCLKPAVTGTPWFPPVQATQPYNYAQHASLQIGKLQYGERPSWQQAFPCVAFCFFAWEKPGKTKLTFLHLETPP